MSNVQYFSASSKIIDIHAKFMRVFAHVKVLLTIVIRYCTIICSFGCTSVIRYRGGKYVFDPPFLTDQFLKKNWGDLGENRKKMAK